MAGRGGGGADSRFALFLLISSTDGGLIMHGLRLVIC